AGGWRRCKVPRQSRCRAGEGSGRTARNRGVDEAAGQGGRCIFIFTVAPAKTCSQPHACAQQLAVPVPTSASLRISWILVEQSGFGHNRPRR
ncbi:hypothetical protein FOMPIDRAFT_122451, partial [Fomitopsis schrenkii]